jgi:hypothetical protein
MEPAYSSTWASRDQDDNPPRFTHPFIIIKHFPKTTTTKLDSEPGHARQSFVLGMENLGSPSVSDVLLFLIVVLRGKGEEMCAYVWNMHCKLTCWKEDKQNSVSLCT